MEEKKIPVDDRSTKETTTRELGGLAAKLVKGYFIVLTYWLRAYMATTWHKQATAQRSPTMAVLPNCYLVAVFAGRLPPTGSSRRKRDRHRILLSQKFESSSRKNASSCCRALVPLAHARIVNDVLGNIGNLDCRSSHEAPGAAGRAAGLKFEGGENDVRACSLSKEGLTTCAPSRPSIWVVFVELVCSLQYTPRIAGSIWSHSRASRHPVASNLRL